MGKTMDPLLEAEAVLEILVTHKYFWPHHFAEQFKRKSVIEAKGGFLNLHHIMNDSWPWYDFWIATRIEINSSHSMGPQAWDATPSPLTSNFYLCCVRLPGVASPMNIIPKRPLFWNIMVNCLLCVQKHLWLCFSGPVWGSGDGDSATNSFFFCSLARKKGHDNLLMLAYCKTLNFPSASQPIYFESGQLVLSPQAPLWLEDHSDSKWCSSHFL